MSLPTNFFIGRGGLSEFPAITGSNLTNVSSYTGASGTVYYKATSVTSSSLEVLAGGVLYVAMVGAGGGAGRRSPGGNGGLGIAKITIPTTDVAGNAISKLLFLKGNRGSYQTGQNGHNGGSSGGGSAGDVGSYYSNDSGGSGGGVVGIQAGASGSNVEGASHSGNNIHLAYVGSGGGGAHIGNADASNGGGHGGGVGRNGVDGYYDGTTAGYQAHGGTTTAGGAHAVEPSYVPQNATDGSALTGGDGGDSDYDGSGGGGAGYFGGGGGKGGGGYDGGPGGGGSGFAISGSEIIYAAETTGSTPGLMLKNELVTETGDTLAFFSNSINISNVAGRGPGSGTFTNGEDGEIFVWNGQ